jgi:hypothetical protein
MPIVLQSCNGAFYSPAPLVTVQDEPFIQSIAVVSFFPDDSLEQLGAEQVAEELLNEAAFMRIGRS